MSFSVVVQRLLNLNNFISEQSNLTIFFHVFQPRSPEVLHVPARAPISTSLRPLVPYQKVELSLWKSVVFLCWLLITRYYFFNLWFLFSFTHGCKSQQTLFTRYTEYSGELVSVEERVTNIRMFLFRQQQRSCVFC